MFTEDLTAAEVPAGVVKERFGLDARRPLSLALDDGHAAGLEETDGAALDTSWKSQKKQM